MTATNRCGAATRELQLTADIIRVEIRDDDGIAHTARALQKGERVVWPSDIVLGRVSDFIGPTRGFPCTEPTPAEEGIDEPDEPDLMRVASYWTRPLVSGPGGAVG
jgi:hypothetical protein